MTGKFKTLALLAVFGCGLWLLQPQVARADSFTLQGCSACDGNAYTMTYYPIGTNTYGINLSIDASGFVANNGSGGPLVAAWLMAVAPNITGWSNATLTSAPGGASLWTQPTIGGLDSSGCKVTSKSPFFCSSATKTGPSNATLQSAPLDFTWTITDASLPTGTNGVALKVLFETTAGSQGCQKTNGSLCMVGSLLSTEMTLGPGSPVPEPTGLLLLGTGILGLAWAVKKYALV